jgi:glycolate oxidase FAD binding subunit
MVGARGTLGVLLEISLKVLPKPAKEIMLVFQMPAGKAIVAMNTWAGRPLPLSAACHVSDTLYIRLSGTESGVRAAQVKLGGEPVTDDDAFWRQLREHELNLFQDDAPLWRISVPPATTPIDIPGKWLIDWGGAQRWLKSAASTGEIRRVVEPVGGHAGMFRAPSNGKKVHGLLPPELVSLHCRLKQAFDPNTVLNATAR